MRFLRFNGVGAIGFGVQLSVLALLMRADVHYLVATAVAVEASVLNNYLWHERWTWRDRPAVGRGRLLRLLRFHVFNGIVSIAGSVALTGLFVEQFGMTPIIANAAAVLACGAVNFFGSDRLVFTRKRLSRNPSSFVLNPKSSIPNPQSANPQSWLRIRSADRRASATKVRVAFVQPPVGSVGDPTTNRFS